MFGGDYFFCFVLLLLQDVALVFKLLTYGFVDVVVVVLFVTDLYLLDERDRDTQIVGSG